MKKDISFSPRKSFAWQRKWLSSVFCLTVFEIGLGKHEDRHAYLVLFNISQ